MIWLSIPAENGQRSVYFDIREMDLRHKEGGTSGLVQGLIGDGRMECWAEVDLGEDHRVAILPFWDESGNCSEPDLVEQLPTLKEHLREAMTGLCGRIGDLTRESRPQGWAPVPRCESPVYVAA